MIDLTDFQLALFEGGRSEKTIEAYLSDLQLFALWFSQTNGYELSAETLTATDLREYKQHLVIFHASPATVNRKLAAIRSWAESVGAKDKITAIRGVKEQEQAPKWLERREVSALLREAEKDCLRSLAIVTVLLNTGLRISELCALERQDVEISERKGALTVRDGKGEKERTIPLNLTARQVLAKRIEAGPNFDPSWKIFGNAPRTYQGILSELGRRARIDHLTPHRLRHTFAKSLIDAGVSIDQVATLLGHDSIETTRIYTTPGQADLERAVQALD